MASPKHCISRANLKSTIANSLKNGGATLPAVASRLRVSTRSLQRQLALLGISYSELVDEVREETAKSLLATHELGIAQIGAAIGYRDPSSFSRAFMRWTQMSPREYRAGIRRRNPSKTAVLA